MRKILLLLSLMLFTSTLYSQTVIVRNFTGCDIQFQVWTRDASLPLSTCTYFISDPIVVTANTISPTFTVPGSFTWVIGPPTAGTDVVSAFFVNFDDISCRYPSSPIVGKPVCGYSNPNSLGSCANCNNGNPIAITWVQTSPTSWELFVN